MTEPQTEDMLLDIQLMQQGHPLWDKTIDFARNCSWKAGPYLARMMEANAFQDWERVISASEEDAIAGFCTLTEKDELPEEYGYKPFIGFVFVDEAYRGRRLSEKMISQASRYAKELGYRTIYLMSGEHGLYEKYGFEKIGEFDTIFGTHDQLFRRPAG